MRLNEKNEEPSETHFKQALTFLESLQFHKIKLGLAPMRDFLAKAGNPEGKLKIIHVAGTNGKGSVCSSLVSIMAKADFRIGLYTSPHLSSPLERFRINDSFISRADFTRITQHIQTILDGGLITYFEFTTALALIWFAEQGVDFAVLETGLGGRLDATNVVEKPLLTIITSVSMDHEMYLGETIELVASEKAGIIKEDVPVICGSRDESVVAVVREFSKRLKAPLYCIERDFNTVNCSNRTWDYSAGNAIFADMKSVENSKPGKYQADNSAVVLTAVQLLQKDGVKVSEQQIREGLATANWPGRLEYIEKEMNQSKFRFLLDGAHNPAGVISLIESLQYYTYDKLYCIWGAMADKNIVEGLNSILPHADSVLLTDVDSERAAGAKEMYALVDAKESKKCICPDCSAKALEHVYSNSLENDLIVVAGSLYLIGELRAQLVGELVG